MYAVADKMDIPPKRVNIAYRLSSSPRNADFAALSSPHHLVEMIGEVKNELSRLKRAKKEDALKSFHILLKDLRNASGKKSGDKSSNLKEITKVS